ncbi:3',5'-cyclic AMP phosphodiesterase CpdA [Haloactinospora alba]|uniref:3',5'-cyclic AMP phosphodiesterase CpdA n=1 Tax=Haloactinospora alba TaxID=405555 RepID=A0A543N9A8_9ACTN|nr:metallophosphoesterase [Haloactinospora alba]TQN28398.1 3',5'-cyclic AMP phosphodiesterase CpdA [Haloactinospora alba]
MIVLAHTSDLHLDGGEHSTNRAARVMSYLNGLPDAIDAVLVTGDIADHGHAAEYERANEVLSSPLPVFTGPGNHDTRAAYRDVLLGQPPTDSPVNVVHRAAGALFAFCDSTVPGRSDGYLADETIDWLDRVLADNPEGVPVFVCLHHPPVTLHSPYLDAMRQHGEQRLADLIERNPQVAAVLCGHAHTAAATTFAGRPLLVAPGVSSTLKLPWEPGETFDYEHPPAVAFHVLDEQLRVTTHYRVVP